MKLASLPRVRLAHLPTPLHELSNLSRALQGPRIFVKRDDLTGLALGGNKTRKLEYIMAEAVEQKADTIVTGAAFHSNWCTQAAAAARRLGMRAVLIKTAPSENYDPEDYDGNHLLHFLMGAEMKIVRIEDFPKVQQETMEDLKRKGHRPFLLEATGSTPRGAAGYVHGVLELLSQSAEMGIHFDYLIHTSGSGGTQAGLILGAKAFQADLRIIASTSGSRKQKEQVANVWNHIQEAQKFLNLDVRVSPDDVVVYDQYAGEGYGFMTEGRAEAIRLMAELEGIFLDPVYTSSAVACLIDLCRKGFFKSSDHVVFLHTGGAAALFPYKAPLKAYGLKKSPPWTVPPWSYTLKQ
jgi:L-cysteate sulfo-lyase